MKEATQPPADLRAPKDELLTTATPLKNPWQTLFGLLAAGMSLYYLHSAMFGIYRTEYHLGIFVGLTFVMVFLLYPARAGRPKRAPSPIDLVLAGLSIVTVGYFIVQYEQIVRRLGAETSTDHLMAALAVLLSLEVGRRVLGRALPIVALAMIAYAYFGPHMPDFIAHRGFSLQRIVGHIYLTLEGIFGLMTNVLTSFVILFIFFGAFLNRSGVGAFFIDLAMSIAGRSPGGPAKVAVLASALMGSISGSAIANTVSTGALTIPLMKRTGFKPHVAGAIEPAASIGGMFLPPVMGAGIFVMVELTGIPYVTIMLASIVPAILYMLSVWVKIHFYSKRHGIVGLSSAEIPKLNEVLRQRWFLVLPLVLVMTLLLLGYSPGFAAVWGIAAAVLASWFTRDNRMGPRAIWAALVEGGQNTLVVGATVGIIGIILGMIHLTGFGLKFTTLFLSLTGDSLLLAIALVALASLILGLGMPVTAAYLVVAVLAAPALVELGVGLLAAHLIIYWFSQDSNITPPVALAAYAGAAIAQADPWKTGWTAFRFAKMLYVMPLLFAYSPILMDGPWDQVIITWISATIGTVAFGALMMAYLQRQTTLPEWLVLAGATFLCFLPSLWSTTVGVALLIGIYLLQPHVELSFRRGLRRLSPGTP